MDKILLILLDGIGDRPVAELGDKTPLQFAKAPNLDGFARRGANGMMDVIAPGIRAGSDTSHLALFGYDPYKVYTGRGPFEAAGVGLELEPGDIAFRCNFATVDEELNVLDRRAGRIKERTNELAAAMNGLEVEDVTVVCKEATEHRAVLILRGEELSPDVADVDPHMEMKKVMAARPLSPAGKRTAGILTEVVKESHRLFRDHDVNRERDEQGKMPANILLPRGAGMTPVMTPMAQRYDMRFAAIVGVSLIKGICRVAGMELIHVEGATGGVDTDMNAKVSASIEALDKYDFVFLHIKAPDVFGHDGDARGKKQIIEKIDGALAPLKSVECLRIITGDHSTPVAVRDHSGDPSPITFVGEGVRTDAVSGFDERACATGGLNRIRGKDVINMALNLTKRAEKFGA